MLDEIRKCSANWFCLQGYRCTETSSTVDGLIEQIFDPRPDYFTWVWSQTQRLGINMVLACLHNRS